MNTYAIIYFPDFSPCWEKSHYAFKCVTRIPEFFETIIVPTRDGNFEGIVVDIVKVEEPKYSIATYKI